MLTRVTDLLEGRDMGRIRELSVEECVGLLPESGVGRAAICPPNGPHVVPVNDAVQDDSIVFRTTPCSVLGTYGWAGEIAFEVDRLDMDRHEGWSVVAVGRGMVDDIDELEEIRWAHDPQPWAEGVRPLYVRLQWRDITGRRVG
jgi:nitroimidazol reductase NimA-like FMN-containing flavoprotein (pyridoxamine 5'-phosphate oxidase superfamily)